MPKRPSTKYYILVGGKPIRATTRQVWEDWMATVDPDILMLAKNEFENITLTTVFRGVVDEEGGVYETQASSASSERPQTIRRYPGTSSGTALTGHLDFVSELRSQYEDNQKQ